MPDCLSHFTSFYDKALILIKWPYYHGHNMLIVVKCISLPVYQIDVYQPNLLSLIAQPLLMAVETLFLITITIKYLHTY